MPSKPTWPDSNTPHNRLSSPKLTSPVMVLVDDTNMEPTKQSHQEMFAEQVEPEQRGGVNILLMKRHESSRYRDDSNTGEPPDVLSAMERESMWEDDIPYSGENTWYDGAPLGESYEPERASIASGLGRPYSSFSPRRGLARHATYTESVYNTAPSGTDPTSTGPSRESAYSVAGGYCQRPMSKSVGKPGAYYSLADMDQFASLPATDITIAEGINSASCRPAPLRPTRNSNSGSTTTKGDELRSDMGLSQRTSTTTTCSSSLRNSAKKSNKVIRTPSAASQRPERRLAVVVEDIRGERTDI
ncbi:hypothetical protein J3458_001344 [Metarhizium acridum]|uniref:uncharacterized protein n=1 Tax=Metarhizium acridum TaxID=92637 RepID=UPI001C6CCA0A|nr:hypothetical protein J3458_001344 [Metarhizium acridum]